MLFPAFSQALINDAREQTLRVIADHLLGDDGDYRELFTTRHSFMTRHARRRLPGAGAQRRSAGSRSSSPPTARAPGC